jgi:hypothetical protein
MQVLIQTISQFSSSSPKGSPLIDLNFKFPSIKKFRFFRKKEFVDKDVNKIGRGSPYLPPRDFCLEKQFDRYLSRNHAKIIFKDGTYFVKDNSTNGTWINEEQIPKGEEVELPKECILKLAWIENFHAGTHLRVSIEDSENNFPEEEVEHIMRRFDNDLLEAKERLKDEEWKKLCEQLTILIERIERVESAEELKDILKGMVDTINAAQKLPSPPKEPININREFEEIISDENLNRIKNILFSSGIFNEIKKEFE